METSLPTPMTARVYVNLPEGKIFTIWLFNIAMENPNHKWRFIAGKIIYKWAIYTRAMLNNQRVNQSTFFSHPQSPWVVGGLNLATPLLSGQKMSRQWFQPKKSQGTDWTEQASVKPCTWGSNKWFPVNILIGGLEHGFYDFPFSWEWNNHPNWRSPSFFRGVGQPPTSIWISFEPIHWE